MNEATITQMRADIDGIQEFIDALHQQANAMSAYLESTNRLVRSGHDVVDALSQRVDSLHLLIKAVDGKLNILCHEHGWP